VGVQYREVQGSESHEFLELFKTIHLLSGGVDSGFHHVKPHEYKPKLLHVKGVRDHVRVTEVKLENKSLNNSHVFILDHGLQLFIWNGGHGGIFEKRKAQEVVSEIKSKRDGKPTVDILDALEENETFWKALGGKPSSELPKDTEEKVVEIEKALFELSDVTGGLKLTQVAKGDIKRSALKSSAVFILDSGDTVYAWIGKDATKKERAQAIIKTTHYLKHHKRPFGTPIARVLEGHETPAFLKRFAS